MSVANRALRMGRSVSSRKVVTYRSNHFTGFVHSKKNKRQIQYESILERDYIMLIESDRAIDSYREQVPLAWMYGDERFVTTFDFEVALSPSRKYLVEIKPLSKVLKHNLIELYAHARAWAIKKGYVGLELWTDRELKALPRLTNSELTVASNTTYYDEKHHLTIGDAASELLASGGTFTIGDLRAASNLGEHAYRMAIRLIAEGKYVPVDPRAPLDDHAVLTAADRT
jgi:hypothetical protein